MLNTGEIGPPCGSPFLCADDNPILYRSGVEPFSDQAQDHRICDAIGYHLASPLIINTDERAANVASNTALPSSSRSAPVRLAVHDEDFGQVASRKCSPGSLLQTPPPECVLPPAAAALGAEKGKSGSESMGLGAADLSRGRIGLHVRVDRRGGPRDCLALSARRLLQCV